MFLAQSNVFETPSVGETALKILKKVNQVRKEFVCIFWNGRHELYKNYSSDRVWQECYMCHYKTPGWQVDRKDLKKAS